MESTTTVARIRPHALLAAYSAARLSIEVYSDSATGFRPVLLVCLFDACSRWTVPTKSRCRDTPAPGIFATNVMAYQSI